MTTGPRRFSITLAIAAILALGAGRPAFAAEAAGGDVAVLARAYNTSAADLAGAFGKAPGNLVLSPYSIGTAMAMTMLGAAGDTAAEMAKVLRQTLPPDGVAEANARIMPLLSRAGGSGAVRIDVANALFATSKFGRVAKDYTDLIQQKFGGEFFVGADLDRINAFVNEKTAGKIDKILSQLSPNSAAVLVNAIYFKAPWAEPFNPAQTRDGEFRVSASEAITIPVMHRNGRYSTVERPGFKAIRLPYADDGLAMIVVMPEEIGALSTVAEKLGADDEGGKLIALLAEQAPAQVALSLPRFKASYEADLVAAYKGLGMTLAFDPAKADFSRITGSPNSEGEISISQIKHRAVVEVAEEGTEAAAATAVEVFARSAIKTPEFRVDRPFLFFIADKATGAVLFSGRIADPR